MKLLRFCFTSFVLVAFYSFSKAQSGCIDNNHGGDFIYSTLISGTTYDYDGTKVAHSYDSATPCNSEIQGTSSYSACNIYKSGVFYGSGSFVDYKIVNCPIDNQNMLLIATITLIGSYQIRKSL